MFLVYKKQGETPLECLNRIRLEMPEKSNKNLSYAGRLDPMAEGKILIIEDEENKNREKFLNLDKEYEVEIVFGIETDTGDALGIIKDYYTNFSLEGVDIKKELQKFVGKRKQKFPWFSSRTVFGIPLFEWKKSGREDEVDRPEKEIEIFNIEEISQGKISSKDLLKEIEQKINRVSGDFRQKEILESWKRFLSQNEQNFCFIKIKSKVSSGTYMRVLAEEIGKSLKTRAFALSIKRTQIFLLDDIIA